MCSVENRPRRVEEEARRATCEVSFNFIIVVVEEPSSIISGLKHYTYIIVRASYYQARKTYDIANSCMGHYKFIRTIESTLRTRMTQKEVNLLHMNTIYPIRRSWSGTYNVTDNSSIAIISFISSRRL